MGMIKKSGFRVSYVVMLLVVLLMLPLPDFIMAGRSGCTHMSFCSYGRGGHGRRKKNVDDDHVNGGGGRRKRSDDDGGGGKSEPRVDQPNRVGSDSSGYGDYEDYYYRRYGDVPSPGIGH